MFPKIVGFPSKIIHFNRVFQYKPSILGAHPYFWKHPNSFSSQTPVFMTLLVGDPCVICHLHPGSSSPVVWAPTMTCASGWTSMGAAASWRLGIPIDDIDVCIYIYIKCVFDTCKSYKWIHAHVRTLKKTCKYIYRRNTCRFYGGQKCGWGDSFRNYHGISWFGSAVSL